jgi:hypothetical protein
LAVRDWLKATLDKKGKRPSASKTRGHIKGLMHRIFDCAMQWEYLPPDRNPMLGANRGLFEAEKETANSHSR